MCCSNKNISHTQVEDIKGCNDEFDSPRAANPILVCSVTFIVNENENVYAL